jgi:hypothetical protein
MCKCENVIIGHISLKKSCQLWLLKTLLLFNIETHCSFLVSYILKLQWWCLSVTGLSVLHNPVTVSMAELCGPARGGEGGGDMCVRLSVRSMTVPRFN